VSIDLNLGTVKYVTSKAVTAKAVTSKGVDNPVPLSEPHTPMFTPKTEAEVRATLSESLKRFRALRGLSQEDLATLAGVNRTFVSQIERETKNVSIDSLRRIANALECEVYTLLSPDTRS
jgi:DNA-binding XRE family transcriptional regulator